MTEIWMEAGDAVLAFRKYIRKCEKVQGKRASAPRPVAREFRLFGALSLSSRYLAEPALVLGGMVLARGATDVAHKFFGWYRDGWGGGLLVPVHFPWGYDEPEMLCNPNRQFGPVGADDGQHDVDALCLTRVEPCSPTEIRALRLRENASQAVFALHLSVTTGLVSQWERGEKQPSGASLKSLTLMARKGLQAVV
ncbi:MAG: hypothetical protein ING13_09770 [Roseomonas sp.]|nr:hypothetical protein [Roseomonas sp.]